MVQRGTKLSVKNNCHQSLFYLGNVREVADVLIAKYGSIEQIPPALIMYTDGGPEHRTTFLSVKIAIIAL